MYMVLYVLVFEPLCGMESLNFLFFTFFFLSVSVSLWLCLYVSLCLCVCVVCAFFYVWCVCTHLHDLSSKLDVFSFSTPWFLRQGLSPNMNSSIQTDWWPTNLRAPLFLSSYPQADVISMRYHAGHLTESGDSHPSPQLLSRHFTDWVISSVSGDYNFHYLLKVGCDVKGLKPPTKQWDYWLPLFLPSVLDHTLVPGHALSNTRKQLS